MSKTAVVTGASSGIGFEITRQLLEENYTLYGLGRSVSPASFNHPGWNPVECDLLDPDQIQSCCGDLLRQTDKQIDALILCAGKAWFAPHETHQPEQISEMIDLNLKAPLLLTNSLLRAIRDRKGHIFAVGSISGKIPSPHGGVYGASKAGLHHFLKLLFDETRKSGVKVTEIVPDLTRTPFYDHLNFEPESTPEAHLDPKEVAGTVLYTLQYGQGVITEIELRPQKLQIRKK